MQLDENMSHKILAVNKECEELITQVLQTSEKMYQQLESSNAKLDKIRTILSNDTINAVEKCTQVELILRI